jgi:type I restriction enzyme R subunit
MAQVENNTREQAMKGNLRSAVEKGVVRAMRSHQVLATQVLKADKQGMDALADLIYDLIRTKQSIDMDDLTS